MNLNCRMINFKRLQKPTLVKLQLQYRNKVICNTFYPYFTYEVPVHVQVKLQLFPYNHSHLRCWLQYYPAFLLRLELIPPALRIIQTAR